MEEKVFNLEEFAGGALSEKFNSEIQKVLDNIYDPNTDVKKVRTLELKVKFEPTTNRDGAKVSIQANTKLAPVVPTETTIGIGQDIKTGKVVAAEFKNQLPGQLGIKVDEETGEILTAENDNVVDLKKSVNK